MWTYAWNAEDRLTLATTPDGATWAYAYDPLGRRTAKWRLDADGSPADLTTFAWDGTRLAEQTAPGGTATTWDHLPGTHRPLAQTTHPSPTANLVDRLTGDVDPMPHFHAIVTDLVGTPVELITLEGEIAWQARTTLWGTHLPAAVTDEVECPIRFPGQYEDHDTGLYCNLERYYDPETTRYVSPDPLGLEPADNHHQYTPNPLHWLDPLGRALCRDEPRIEDGNAKQGWQHIDERHIAGTAAGGHGDLMPPTTTRQQVQAAAGRMIAKGNRVSSPNSTLQTFEMRMTVNGFRARYRLVVDSTDGNRVITFFPVGKSYK